MLSGSEYKIRLLSTSPALIGSVSNSFIINEMVMPTISISVSQNPICNGDTATFNTIVTNGGSSPTYNWSKNGLAFASGPGLQTISIPNMANGDAVMCQLVNNSLSCALSYGASSNIIVQTVYQPAVSISASQTNICAGTLVNYIASPVYGGSNPIYQWQVNGNNVGVNSDSFSSNNLTNGQIVTCQLTNNDLCIASVSVVSNPISMTVNNLLSPSVNILASPDSVICTGSTASFTALTNNGGPNPSYQWQINGIDVGNNSPLFSSGNFNNGDTLTCQLISNENCLSFTSTVSAPITLDIVNTLQPAMDIVSNTNSICQGEQITFDVINIQNQGSSPNFQWKKNGINLGYNLPQLITSELQTGDIITCEMTSSLSCANLTSTISNSIAVNVIPNNFSLAFSADYTSLNQAPFLVNFTNTTPNLTSYFFTWYFGDGASSNDVNPSHLYNYDGTYNVTLVAENLLLGCKDTLMMSNYITCLNTGSNCNHQAQISSSGLLTTCQNGAILLTASTDAQAPTYQWIFNGVNISGATQNTFTASTSGNYSVLIYSFGTCPTISNTISLDFSGPPAPTPQINTSGFLLPCGQGNITLSANTNGASLTWSNGATTPSITVNQGGLYYVSADYGQGCVATSQTIFISSSSVNNPGICMATVDSISNNHIIVWETPLGNDIDSFYIYKESNQYNFYNKIAEIGYDQLSAFNVVNISPSVQGGRYKLAVRDTCGGITSLSSHHKTMHLQVFSGTGNSRQLIWSQYEGLNFNNYKVTRKLPGQSYQLLATLPNTELTYIDLNPGSTNALYRIEIDLTQICNSVDRYAYEKSLSNAATNQAFFVGTPELNKNILFGNLSIKPNPSEGSGELTFESDRVQKVDLIVSNVAGQIIQQKAFVTKKGINSYNIAMAVSGLYFVEIIDDSQNKLILKWIVR